VNQATNTIGLEWRALAAWAGFRKRGRSGRVRSMTRPIGLAPSLEKIDTLARAALARLPEPFARHLDGVRLVVEDFADTETLTALGIGDAFELTGIYEGVPLGEKHAALSGALPDRIRLFRSAILDEWIARGDETLEYLVAHVLVHEVGHHFGLSDADIAALEGEVE
jgi:predicted Zn-dependent protease with MMP-like domain